MSGDITGRSDRFGFRYDCSCFLGEGRAGEGFDEWIVEVERGVQIIETDRGDFV